MPAKLPDENIIEALRARPGMFGLTDEKEDNA